MSAPNFKNNCNSVFPMMVVSNEDVCRMYIELEDGEEYSECDFNFAFYMFHLMQLKDELDDLNDELQWYNLKIESGYYTGLQILVDTEWCNIGEWSDEDCMDEFELNKKETIQMILDEQKKICKYLESTTQYGFREIVCGVFSNEEAVYHYVQNKL